MNSDNIFKKYIIKHLKTNKLFFEGSKGTFLDICSYEVYMRSPRPWTIKRQGEKTLSGFTKGGLVVSIREYRK